MRRSLQDGASERFILSFDKAAFFPQIVNHRLFRWSVAVNCHVSIPCINLSFPCFHFPVQFSFQQDPCAWILISCVYFFASTLTGCFHHPPLLFYFIFLDAKTGQNFWTRGFHCAFAEALSLLSNWSWGKLGKTTFGRKSLELGFVKTEIKKCLTRQDLNFKI